MDLMDDLAETLATGGRAQFWKHTYPNLRSYHNSMTRLRKSGLVVQYHGGAKLPHLRLTTAGKESLPAYHHPEKFWNTDWNGVWYMLIFDVPEKERHYRDNLRGFLKRMRMGCLQKSVWITPRDIRPEYDDLERAANLKAVAYLLESRTVLHHDTLEMVQNSWDFDRLLELHDRYLSVFNDNLERLNQLDHDKEALLILLRQDAEAYVQCMLKDPLLPNTLLPKTYLGKKVYELHQAIRRDIGRQLIKYLV